MAYADDEWVEEFRPPQPVVRQCLRCAASFESQWIGERICRRCKATQDWRSCGHLEGVSY